MASDPVRAKIYPGVPEYFDSEGRGMYHYLTGSASWYVLAQLTQAFGVRGQGGDLVLSPKLVKEQFGDLSKVQVSCPFADRKLTVIYENPKKLEYGQYSIKDVSLNGTTIIFEQLSPSDVKVKRQYLLNANENLITVVLQ